MTAAVEAKLRFEEATVHVRTVGAGPPLLLINGLGAHTAMWQPLERVLQGFRIIEFDLPGAGSSAVPRRPVSVSLLARLATSVLNRFDIEQADVLGYSMGGIVAQQLAVDAPERVRRLMLVATTPGVGAVQGDLKAVFNIMTPLRYHSQQAYARTAGSLVGGRARRDPAWVAEQGELRFAHPPTWRGYMGQLSSISKWSGLPILQRIHQPVLVITGDDDPLTPVANAMMLTHLLPRGRMIVYPGEGHLIPLDPDSRAHADIRDFFSAPDLEQSPVWRGAATVSADELRTALSTVGRQLPPWSRANAKMRRRWLNLGTSRPQPVRA